MRLLANTAKGTSQKIFGIHSGSWRELIGMSRRTVSLLRVLEYRMLQCGIVSDKGIF